MTVVPIPIPGEIGWGEVGEEKNGGQLPAQTQNDGIAMKPTWRVLKGEANHHENQLGD